MLLWNSTAFNYGCRPQVDFSGCPENTRAVLAWTYWSIFALRAAVTFGIIIYAFWLFPVPLLRLFCPKRLATAKQGAKASLYYVLLAIIGNSSGAIFSFIMANPNRYGLNSMISILFYTTSVNIVPIGGVLTLFTWAELVYNDSLQLKSSMLDRYKTLWYIYHAVRFCTQLPLSILSASNLNSSYLITHRVWLFDWTWLPVVLGIFLVIVSRQLLTMLRSKQFGDGPTTRVVRFRLVFMLVIILTSVATAAHSILLEYIDNTAWASIVVILSYHVPQTIVSVWFIVAEPVKFPVSTTNTPKPQASTGHNTSIMQVALQNSNTSGASSSTP